MLSILRTYITWILLNQIFLIRCVVVRKFDEIESVYNKTYDNATVAWKRREIVTSVINVVNHHPRIYMSLSVIQATVIWDNICDGNRLRHPQTIIRFVLYTPDNIVPLNDQKFERILFS